MVHFIHGDFVVNVTIDEDFLGLLEIPFTIYGDGFGNPVHEVSGSADVPTYEFNIYRSDGGQDNGFVYLTTVMGFSYVDLELMNGQEYCYYVTQIVDGKAESQESNIMCATPNLPPAIEVDPLSFYEVMNPEMLVTRPMTIKNTTGGPLDLAFDIIVGSEPPKDNGGHTKTFPKATAQDASISADHYNFVPTDAYMECPEGGLFGLLPDMGTGAATSDAAPAPSGYTCYQYIDAPGIFETVGFWGINLVYSGGWLGCDNEDPMPFAIGFYEDNAGEPGTLLYTENVLLTRFDTEELLFGAYPLYYWETTLTSSVMMTNGWVSIQGLPSTPDDCWFLWKGATAGTGEAYLQWDGSELGVGAYPLAICLGGSEIPPPEGFVYTTPETGIVPPGETFDVDVTFNSSGLGAGYYADELYIYSNDLNNPLVVVPVAIEIFQPSVSVEPGLHSNGAR
ncbi:MAG: hypothetical protein B6D64_04090 [Bacteroidetes bacterium 4484_276]|nr:MAG: hypothetical protein B6D64_04090 [Bacteroidetes bacterium 4484_276]